MLEAFLTNVLPIPNPSNCCTIEPPTTPMSNCDIWAQEQLEKIVGGRQWRHDRSKAKLNLMEETVKIQELKMLIKETMREVLWKEQLMPYPYSHDSKD